LKPDLEREPSLLIRIGFEFVVDCPKLTPMLLALCPHSENRRRTIGTGRIQTAMETPTHTYIDMFGNRCARLLAPTGRLSVWSDCIVEDSGLPGEFDWNARQHEIMDLPSETLTCLAASRYCESDELGEIAWRMFGSTPPGWGRV